MDIRWSNRKKLPGADPVATLRVRRDSWTELGARFHRVDDGQGEKPRLAIATVDTALGPVDVGVLVYDDSDLSYLLIATEKYPPRVLDAVLDSLAARSLGAKLVYDRYDTRVAAKVANPPNVRTAESRAEGRPAGRSRKARARGTVHTWDSRRGIGYIEPDSGGPRVVVEREDIAPDASGRRKLKVGERVEYDVVKNADRPRLAASKSGSGTTQPIAVRLREAE